ncbi:hypothetical protein HK100_011679 [Physocladia obscura]|uniref:RGS domain-containing protein n=1 Tax=Physocladia obscura TaxID=109957 RepID=A0AAD5T0V4_9FUNG|nr:hypothetical protein HK100_011679 [Physocladia obscura]
MPPKTPMSSPNKSQPTPLSLSDQSASLTRALELGKSGSFPPPQDRPLSSPRLPDSDTASVKITVQQVLEDRFLSPFSMKDFHEFLIKERSEENIDFYLELKSYERLCLTIPVDLLKNTMIIPTDLEQAAQLKRARDKINDLVARFFKPGKKQELNVPAKLSKPLLIEISVNNNIHPEIFKGVLENVYTMLRLSSFPNFQRLALSKGKVIPNITLTQVLENEHAPPNSFADFYQYLQKEGTVENIEFYKAFKDYERHFSNIDQNMSNDDQKSEAQVQIFQIISTFFTKDSKHELNVSEEDLNLLLNEINTKGNIIPTVFEIVLQKVLTKLELSEFPNFMNRKEKITITTALPKEIKSSISESPLSPTKISVRQEHSEENIEFFLALEEYSEICNTIPEYILRNAIFSSVESPDTLALSRAVVAVLEILDKFFTKGSSSELNIPSNLSKQLIQSIKEKHDIRPNIFNNVLENVLMMLKLSSFPNFIKLAATKGNVKLRASQLENENEDVDDEYLEPILSVVDARKFSMNNIFAKLETWQCLRQQGIITEILSEETSQNSTSQPFEILPVSVSSGNLSILTTSSAHNTRRPSIVPDLMNVLSDNYLPPFSLNDFLAFLKAEHSQENISFYLDVQEYQSLCSQVPAEILENISQILETSEYFELIKKIEFSVEEMIRKYLTVGSTMEVNLPVVLVKPFLHSVKDQHDFRPDIFKGIIANVFQMMKLSSFPNFQKQALTKGALKLKISLKQVISDELPPPMSLNGAEDELEFYFSVGEYKTLMNSMGEELSNSVQNSGRSRIKSIVEKYFTPSKHELKYVPDQMKIKLMNELTSKGSPNLQIFDEMLDFVLDGMKKSSYTAFLKEVNPDAVTSPSTESPVVKSSTTAHEKRISSTSEVKPTVIHVLEDRFLPPFSRADFYEFILNEHSEENYAFYMAVKDYQAQCENLPAFILMDTTLCVAGSTESLQVTWARTTLEKIQSKFLTKGVDTELNIPAKIMNPLIEILNTKKNIHPSIFNNALDNVLTMMRLSSFPVFCKAASQKGPPKLKLTFQNVVENLLRTPASLEDFRQFLELQKKQYHLDFYIAFEKYVKLTSDVPDHLLKAYNTIAPDNPNSDTVEIFRNEMNQLLEDFITKNIINLEQSVRENILDQVQNQHNISSEVLHPAFLNSLNFLKESSFPNFAKKIEAEFNPRHSVNVSPKIKTISDKKDTETDTTTAQSAKKNTFGKRVSNVDTDSSSSFTDSQIQNEEQSPVIETQTSPKRLSSLEFKPTVSQVLEDQLAQPFSRKDFYDFIKNEHSEENYDFYMAVKDYQLMCEKIPEALLRNLKKCTAENENFPKIERAISAVEKLQKKFLTSGLDTELNIPSKIMKPLLEILNQRENIHPEIFNSALENVLAMIRLSSFPVFFKAALAKGEPKLKPTVQQVLNDQLPPPLSLNDFHEFLKREHSEENIEFYLAFKKYEKNCEHVPRELLENIESRKTDALGDFALKLQQLKHENSEIIAKFFTLHGEYELNVPIVLKAPLLNESSKNNIHPDIYEGVLANVLTMLRLSSFPNFVKETSKKRTESSSPSKPDLQETNQNFVENSTRNSKILRPKSWVNNTGVASPKNAKSAKRSFDSPRSDDLVVTMQDIFDDALEPPFSRNDYEFYLVGNSDVMTFEFFKAYKEYGKLCENIPANHLRDSRAHKDSETCDAFLAAMQILSQYFSRTSSLDLNIPPDTKKFLLAQITETRNIHPEVFQDAIESILKHHKSAHFAKFYLSASVKGPVKLKNRSTNETNFIARPIPENLGSALKSTPKMSAENILKNEISEENSQIRSSSGVLSNVPVSIDTKTSSLDRISAKIVPVENSWDNTSTGVVQNLTSKSMQISFEQQPEIKFGVLQVLDDRFSPPFSFRDFQRYLRREDANEIAEFYLQLKEYRKLCECITEGYLRDPSTVEKDSSDVKDLEKAKSMIQEIIATYFISGGENELNVAVNVLQPLLSNINNQNIHPEVFDSILENLLINLRLSSFTKFYKEALDKGPITLKYTLQQVLDDQLLPPISLKDFHNFLVRDHSSENIEFYLAVRRYQQLWENLPPSSREQAETSISEPQISQCKDTFNEIINRFIVPKALIELNVPQSLRTAILTDIAKPSNSVNSTSSSNNTSQQQQQQQTLPHPDIFKEILANVLGMLKLSSFPKFQKEVQMQVAIDDSFSFKSNLQPTAPFSSVTSTSGSTGIGSGGGVICRGSDDSKHTFLEIADTTSRVTIAHRILTRLGLQSFTFEDPTDSSSTRDRISTMWKVGGEANTDVQFADMVTPAQIRLGLQQTLDDKIPPPLSCRDFRTYLKKEKKAHYVDFYLSVKRYKRLCEKVPEGILNNPSNASQTNPSPLPANSAIARIRAELTEILQKYVEQPESKYYLDFPAQIKMFLNSEVSRNGNWTPHIFDGAVQHICAAMQRSSFPGFYKMATTKAKGVKLKIVGTKKTSKGVHIAIAEIGQSPKTATTTETTAAVVTGSSAFVEQDEEEEEGNFLNEASENFVSGKLSNLLFQVLADKTDPPLSRNDFYNYLKKEHSAENFDFYISIVNYRKICEKTTAAAAGTTVISISSNNNDEIRESALKIIDTFLVLNAPKEISVSSKVKSSILHNVYTENNFDPNIFNDAFIEVLSIMRVSSFPNFFNENSKDLGDEAGLNTIVPEDLERQEIVDSDLTSGEDPLIGQVLQNRLSPPLSLAGILPLRL